MLTTTGRRHLINAVRKAALVNAIKAAEIVDSLRNLNAIPENTPLHGVKGLARGNADQPGYIGLFLPNADGGQDYVGTLYTPSGFLNKWTKASLPRAYGMDPASVETYEAELGIAA